MQQVVGLLRQGLAQVLPVQGLHVRILVGEADGALRIQLVELLAPLGGKVLAVVDGLAAPPEQPPGQAMTSTKS